MITGYTDQEREIDNNFKAKLNRMFDNGPARQACRVYDYWRGCRKSPQMSFDLAVAAWTDNKLYEAMKRGDLQ